MKTNNINSPKAVFFQIKDVKSKVIKLIQTALYHFQKKEPIIIFVNDSISETFVDEILWKQPLESFLPHVVSQESSSDFIVITKTDKNLNNAHFIFNLCPQIPMIDKTFKTIYDYDDLTSQKKQELSKKRFDDYRNMGFVIESR